MKITSIMFLAAATFAAILAGCGGGGAGGSSNPNPAATGAIAAPSVAPSVASSTTPSAAPSTSTQSISGNVVDVDHASAPVNGATIQVGTGFTYSGGGYVLSGVLATATSAADGTFTIAEPTGALYVQVSGPGALIPTHRPLPAAGTASFAATFSLATANADESAGLATLNSNRAKYGSGQGAQPITFDSDEMFCARAHAADEATKGYYSHITPGTNLSYSATCLIGLGQQYSIASYQPGLENLDAISSATSTSGGSLAAANNVYIASGPADGHFQLVVSKTDLFAGLGAAYNGKPDSTCTGSACVSESYFVEDYTSTTGTPSS